MSKEMRYHINGFFKEEQRRGFVVCHVIDKHTGNALEIAEILNNFTQDYDMSYCYGLSIGIVEEPTLVE